MSVPAKNLIRFVAAGLTAALLIAAFNFVIDPLQLFGRFQLGRHWYNPDSRMQDAGLIRTQHFDTVFMGTSLAVHFRQSEIDKELGVKSVKLAMSGSTSVEQSFVLDAALRRHPRLVIWQMDDWIFRDAPDIASDAYIPADLYRMNAKGIAGYLYSLETARESLWIALRGFKPLEAVAHGLSAAQYLKFQVDDLNELNAFPAYIELSTAYNSAKARASFAHFLKAPGEIAAGYDYAAMVRNFERDAVGLIAGHPDVTFDIYFPPYSILQFVSMRDASPATLKIVYDFSAYANRRLTSLPNVRLFDFRDAREITHDLNNYADVIHHSHAIDLKLLSWLAAGDHLVSREAPTASVERLKAQVEAYRFDNEER
ncbi:hypothetical protein [Bradyrhizobium sp.]|uniref:hypothetical protein n=1 Tax=Bradyrhizobium sp. TaxID=376 RepID=UPI0025C4ACD1|nr:hypothetical protein [Bradyrhizobium sp.]